jgi:hypothetical protein
MTGGSLARAEEILSRAAGSPPTDQRLLIVAAFREVFSTAPVLVGGGAEAYWMSEEYRPTDIDICPRPSRQDEATLAALGFSREGRHWVRSDLLYGIEFPGAGEDIRRTVEVPLGDATAVVISLEDLYLDRLRQATMTSASSHRHFKDAVAVLLAQWEAVDWSYVASRIDEIAATEDVLVGNAMRALHPKVTNDARNRLASIEASHLAGEG